MERRDFIKDLAIACAAGAIAAEKLRGAEPLPFVLWGETILAGPDFKRILSECQRQNR